MYGLAPMEVARARSVVIGAGSGVGRGIALGLADCGARVVVADIDPVSADAISDEIKAAGGEAVSAVVDGTDRASLRALAEHATATFGGVDILASNIGVLTSAPLDQSDEREWAWAIELNLLSHVRAVDVFLPCLRSAGPPAHIVLTASMAAIYNPARISGVHLGVYSATKHAVLGYGEALRGELADEGIGVSVLCPGMVRSNLGVTSARHRHERHGGPFEPQLPASAGAASEPRPGMLEPEDVGPFVVRGIRDNRLHILTHPEAVSLVEKRHAALVDDFRFFAG
jgi:NAD(P)-dependent dehydrogenase (short-subunit alcohol dehydrogenase family)